MLQMLLVWNQKSNREEEWDDEWTRKLKRKLKDGVIWEGSRTSSKDHAYHPNK